MLQKRLEESNRNSNVFDFDRLAGRDPTSPTLEVPDDPDPQVASKEDEDAVEKDRSLQSVIGSNPNQYQRFVHSCYSNYQFIIHFKLSMQIWSRLLHK